MPKVPLNPRHEAGDVQAVDLEFLDIGQCRKLTQDATVEAARGELVMSPIDLELLDQGKQAKHVHIPNGIGPLKISSAPVTVGDDKGVMEMGNSGDVPGATDLGACAKAVFVVSKIGDDHFNDLQGKPGGRRTVCNRGPRRNTP